MKAKFKEFKVQNMVGSCDVHFPVHLEGLYLSHSTFASYEPELFPGLVYKTGSPRIVLLIFVSGIVVITCTLISIFTYSFLFRLVICSLLQLIEFSVSKS